MKFILLLMDSNKKEYYTTKKQKLRIILKINSEEFIYNLLKDKIRKQNKYVII